jgi:hypothetical protein
MSYKTTRGKLFLFFLLFSLVAQSGSVNAIDNKHDGDEHYTEAGFFDIHVCNWPKRPLFFMALFSTTSYDSIKKIEIFDDKNRSLGELSLDKYRLIMLEKPKREKRVFIKQIEIPASSGNGWYSAHIHLKNNKIITARDYVINHKMDRAFVIKPAADAMDISMPDKLIWKPVAGAAYYQVFINDIWQGKNVYQSALLSKAELKLPKKLLQPGGSYCWRIHARDVNENVLLGDFNHGSVTSCFNFEIRE